MSVVIGRPGWVSVVALGSLVALVLAASTGCSDGARGAELPPDVEASSAEPAEVEVTQVERTEISLPVHASGTAFAIRAADLAAEATGRVTRVEVEEGDEVREGQVLVRLDTRDAQLRAAQAGASAASARVQAEQAAAEYERVEPLAARGAVASSELDQLRAQRDASRQAAEAAAAAASAARQGITDGVVRAPFAGTIERVGIELGEMASANSTHLVRLVDLSEVEVRVSLHEAEMSRVAAGDVVRVRFPAAGVAKEGTVARLSLEIDPATRSGEVLIRVDNGDERLRSGMFAEVELQPSQGREAIALPRDAIVGSGDDTAVYLVDDGAAVRRPVTTRTLSRDLVEIVSGLDGGETVVTAGQSELADGVAVRVRAASPSDDAADVDTPDVEAADAPTPTEPRAAAARR